MSNFKLSHFPSLLILTYAINLFAKVRPEGVLVQILTFRCWPTLQQGTLQNSEMFDFAICLSRKHFALPSFGTGVFSTITITITIYIRYIKSDWQKDPLLADDYLAPAIGLLHLFKYCH